MAAVSSQQCDSIAAHSAKLQRNNEACRSPPLSPSMYGGERGRRLAERAAASFHKSPSSLSDISDSAMENEIAAAPPHTSAFIPSTSHLLMAHSCLVPEVRDENGNPIVWPWDSNFAGQCSKLRSPMDIDRSVRQALKCATASGAAGSILTGVRAWITFCSIHDTTPHRPLDPNEPIWVKLEEEWLAMRFVCDLVESRGIKPRTAAQYFGQAQAWHLREHGIKLAAGLKLERLVQMLKGLRRIHGDSSRKVRRGLRAKHLRAIMDAHLDPAVPEHANIRAALAVAFQGLLRGSEFTVSKAWDPDMDLARVDISSLTPERLVFLMRPGKNMNHLKGKTVPLVIGAGGVYIDAVAEVRNMLAVDPNSPSAAEQTPMFRDARGEALRGDSLRLWIQAAMLDFGEDPKHFGLHSLRIGGATALFAAGADPLVIRTMGRWSSDCYRLYVRACFGQTLTWTQRAGSTQADDVAGEFQEVDSY